MTQELDQPLPLSARADIWRQKVINQTITDEELKEAVEALREGRRLAAEAGTRKRAASAAPARDVAAILGQLMGPSKPETKSD